MLYYVYKNKLCAVKFGYVLNYFILQENILLLYL